MKEFGFFKGMEHEDCEEDINDYMSLKNTISKEKVIKHIESGELVMALSTSVSYDMFTGEKLLNGLYHDGDFMFPTEFLHYYKNYDIGIPYEYEEYLKKILD